MQKIKLLVSSKYEFVIEATVKKVIKFKRRYSFFAIESKMYPRFMKITHLCWIIWMLLIENISSVSISRLTENPQKCRVSGGKYYAPREFALYSCAKCYHYMDKRLFANGSKFVQSGLWLKESVTGERYEPNYMNDSSPIFRTFRNTKQITLWTSCCRAAEKCCGVMRNTVFESDSCPRTWDGWNCWPDTPKDTVQQAECPSYIYFHSEVPQCTRYAKKTCWENSTWYLNHKRNEFTEYSTCGQGEDIKLILKTHLITFGISIVLLVPALGIFFFYRQLRNLRIFLHKNLFISLLLTAVCVIVFESYFIINSINNPESSVLESNQPGCKLFYAVTKYMRLSIYMWMFCEGFYLHKLIAAAFAEQKGTLIFHLIGWVFPILPVGVWALIRQLKADGQCWTVPGDYEWILHAPMLIALIANFCFLTHIMQIIITKLRSTNTHEPAQFRRAVRATMVLIPLFGLHFLFLSYHPKRGDCHFLLMYNITTYSMDGLQGGIVSLLFCYLNNEVLHLLKLSYTRKKMVRDISNHMSNRRPRESRTSVSTNVDSLCNDMVQAKGIRKT